MRPRLRKLALTAHVGASVGWLGAVAASLALAIVGVAAEDPLAVRGAYVSLELLGWYVLVPLSAASLLTGLVSSLGTTWGLFRHYWVVAKLAMNAFAGIVLLMYMQSLDYLARVAAASASSADLTGVRSASPLIHAAGALFLLVIATVLGLYKPKGLTRYGWRKQHERPAALAPQS
jgi:hypothetical protein